jgi:hypothetical protein
MDEQIKMEKNNTTTYITAKKRIGCKAPIVVDLLVLIIGDFGYQKNWIFLLFSRANTSYVVLQV